MTTGDGAIDALINAVRISPENFPLRQALAEMFRARGRYEEAEREYKQALNLSPSDLPTKTALARLYKLLGKTSLASVIVEDLIKQSATPAILLLHAELLAKAGDLSYAARQYRRAIDADPTLADKELEVILGIASPPAREAAVSESGYSGRTEGGAAAEDIAEIERPKISFKDVGGMEGVKEEIRVKIIGPMEHPELYKAYGKKSGGGILMYGPPGCGKTHLARATAGEIKAGFISVGIHDVLNMWLGNSEKNLHELFQRARRNRPCVLFFDEVDALAASRTDMRTSSARHLINQFLAEMDGVACDNEGVLVLAATNAPWHVDAAFRRPGRFDQILFVSPPDAGARSAILQLQLAGKPIEALNYEAIAKKTEGFSGADLKGLVDTAIEKKLRQAMKEGVPKPLTQKELLAAAGAITPSTREWFATAKNYATYSNQGGTYDDILKYMGS